MVITKDPKYGRLGVNIHRTRNAIDVIDISPSLPDLFLRANTHKVTMSLINPGVAVRPSGKESLRIGNIRILSNLVLNYPLML